jgi:hypothetical protein
MEGPLGHTGYGPQPHGKMETTSTETINFSIGFGFAALIYVSLEIFREFYIDFVDIRRGIRVFTQFCLPHHAKCRSNIANSALHAPKPPGTRSKLLWTLLIMEIIFLLMEEMTKLMEVMTTPLYMRPHAILDHQHHHTPHTNVLPFGNGSGMSRTTSWTRTQSRERYHQEYYSSSKFLPPYT